MSVNLDVVLQPPDAVWLLAVAQSLSQGMIAFQYASHRRQSKVSGDSKPLNAFLSALMVLTLCGSLCAWYNASDACGEVSKPPSSYTNRSASSCTVHPG